jgi:hypothetical protein
MAQPVPGPTIINGALLSFGRASVPFLTTMGTTGSENCQNSRQSSCNLIVVDHWQNKVTLK